MVHDHGDAERCPLCPTDDQFSAMRARNREAARLNREAMIAAVETDPQAYVHAVEARSEGDHDIVMHIASTMAKASAWCADRPMSEYGSGNRYHVIPHRLDDIDDRMSGVVSVAVYGVLDGTTQPADLAGTDDE
jgi:hypothetical protein